MADRCVFTDSSRKIAEQFLQTIVVVDDRAFLGEEIHPHSRLKKPGRGASLSREKKEVAEPEERGTDAHGLDAKEFVDRFAEKGLLCSIIKPESASEELGPKMIAVSRRADIVVLDWVIDKIRGDKALELIKQITQDDAIKDNNNRLRLLVVYTGENELIEIADKIEAELKTIHSPVRVDDFTLQWGTSRVAVYAKEGVSVPGHLKTRIISIHKLPDALVNEFAATTMGLLSNFALAGLTAIRENTHRIITKFPPKLDAPYLAHRALLDPPEEAEAHVLPIFVSELESVLKDTRVASHISIAEIEKWIGCRTMSPVDLCRRMKIRSRKGAVDAMVAVIRDGIRAERVSSSYPGWSKILSPLKNESDKKCLSNLTNILTLDGRPGTEFDRELALLMSVNSRYSSPPPSLTLGTIVAEDVETRTSYYVCIQPACDSVRLSEDNRAFPFLRFKIASKSSADDFGYIVKDRDSVVELRLKIRPYEVQQVFFKPRTGSKEIQAVKKDSDWIFTSKEPKERHFRWIADLKQAHAQRVANEFANQISRVGLTESEWLRRNAK